MSSKPMTLLEEQVSIKTNLNALGRFNDSNYYTKLPEN